jgi:hypothetical protein
MDECSALRNQCATAYTLPAAPHGVFLEPDHFGSRRSTVLGEISISWTASSQTPYGLVETLRMWSVALTAGIPCCLRMPPAPTGRPTSAPPTEKPSSGSIPVAMPLRPSKHATADVSQAFEARAGPSAKSLRCAGDLAVPSRT